MAPLTDTVRSMTELKAAGTWGTHSKVAINSSPLGLRTHVFRQEGLRKLRIIEPMTKVR